MSKGPYVGVFRQAAGAWIVLAVAWGIVLVGGLLWLAGSLATWLMGKGLNGPAFDFQMGEDLFLKGPSHLWPEAPVWLVFTIFALLLLALGVPATIVVTNLVRRQMSENDPLNSLADDKNLTHMAPEGIRQRAFALRPDLEDQVPSKSDRKNLLLREAGVPLGTLRPGGTELRASWEDVALAIMAPRSGKTTAIAIPAILDAPGAAVVTSNKADVWAATWALREKDTGERTWLFDPQSITHLPQTWWWNPLRPVRSYDAALRLATHFMQEVDEDEGGEEAFWVSAATDLLTGLILAAALKLTAAKLRETYFRALLAAARENEAKGRPRIAAKFMRKASNIKRIPVDQEGSLYDVYRWLGDAGNDEPIGILETLVNPHVNPDEDPDEDPNESNDQMLDAATAASLHSRMTGAPETRESIYEYARTACRCLRNPHIMRWVVPPDVPLQGIFEDERAESVIEFHAHGFAATRQTMYLLSKDGAASAAPLVAALTDRLMVDATQMAEARYRGRLDPPMLVCLDEAANICKIADLPLLYSHMGSRGIFLLTIFQSRPQARSVWGRDGFDSMWSAATVKLIGAGIDDPDLADDISRLVGDHDITIRSVSQGAGGSYSESVALRREAIMDTSDVRAMAKGTAVLLATGAQPASLALCPWYEGERADEIKAAMRAAHESMEQLASSVPMELVTVNPLSYSDIDLRGPKVSLEKTGDGGPATSEQPVLTPSAPPETESAESAGTTRQATLISQDAEPIDSIAVDADPTQDFGQPTAADRQNPPKKPRPPGRWRPGHPRDN